MSNHGEYSEFDETTQEHVNAMLSEVIHEEDLRDPTGALRWVLGRERADSLIETVQSEIDAEREVW